MAHWVTCGSVLSDEPPSAVCVGGCVGGVGCGPDFGIASFTAGSSSLFEPWPRVVATESVQRDSTCCRCSVVRIA
eukprot:2073682-Prymnesium_polylepis.1